MRICQGGWKYGSHCIATIADPAASSRHNVTGRRRCVQPPLQSWRHIWQRFGFQCSTFNPFLTAGNIPAFASPCLRIATELCVRRMLKRACAGQSLRSSGLVLAVSITYSNLYQGAFGVLRLLTGPFFNPTSCHAVDTGSFDEKHIVVCEQDCCSPACHHSIPIDGYIVHHSTRFGPHGPTTPSFRVLMCV